MWRHADWYKFANFSDKPAASIFRSEEQAKQKSGRKHSAVPTVCSLLGFLSRPQIQRLESEYVRSKQSAQGIILTKGCSKGATKDVT
jgi:hypothetical protein